MNGDDYVRQLVESMDDLFSKLEKLRGGKDKINFLKTKKEILKLQETLAGELNGN
jgi:hypothetical protein